MKRIDFLYGVVSITIFLFLPIFFQVYGFLDVQKYRSVTSDNSYYENSSEPILAYTYYRTLLFYIFTFFIVLLVGLIYVSSKEKDLTRFQIQCYRPYFPYHCMVCLIPFVLRYANMNAYIPDNIMAQVEWNHFFLVMYSIFRFICFYLLSIVRRYDLLRLFAYLFVTLIHSFILTFFVYSICSNCIELFNCIKESKDGFLTAWSSYDQISIYDELNVSNINAYERTFSLDKNLFRSTGKKLYQTSSLSRLQLEDSEGTKYPYQRLTYNVGIGESVSLPCAALSIGLFSVFWSLR